MKHVDHPAVEIAKRFADQLSGKRTLNPSAELIQLPIRDLQLVIDFALMMAKPGVRNNHGRHIEFEGDIFVAFDPTTNDALFSGVFYSLGEAERAVRDCIEGSEDFDAPEPWFEYLS